MVGTGGAGKRIIGMCWQNQQTTASKFRFVEQQSFATDCNHYISHSQHARIQAILVGGSAEPDCRGYSKPWVRNYNTSNPSSNHYTNHYRLETASRITQRSKIGSRCRQTLVNNASWNFDKGNLDPAVIPMFARAHIIKKSNAIERGIDPVFGRKRQNAHEKT